MLNSIFILLHARRRRNSDLVSIDMADFSIWTIKDLGNLLESRATGLHVKEVDKGKLKSDPAGVDGVELPVGDEIFETKRVDVLVDDQGDLNPEIHEHEALGADLEWQDLDSVGNQKPGPSQGIRKVEDPDESNHGFASGRVLVALVDTRTDRPAQEADHHAKRSCKEERTASDFVAQHGACDRDDQAHNGQTTVESQL